MIQSPMPTSALTTRGAFMVVTTSWKCTRSRTAGRRARWRCPWPPSAAAAAGPRASRRSASAAASQVKAHACPSSKPVRSNGNAVDGAREPGEERADRRRRTRRGPRCRRGRSSPGSAARIALCCGCGSRATPASRVVRLRLVDERAEPRTTVAHRPVAGAATHAEVGRIRRRRGAPASRRGPSAASAGFTAGATAARDSPRQRGSECDGGPRGVRRDRCRRRLARRSRGRTVGAGSAGVAELATRLVQPPSQ